MTEIEKLVEECARDIEPGRWRDYDMEAANDPEWAAKHVEVSLRQARAVIARTLEWLEARSETYGEKQRLHALARSLPKAEGERGATPPKSE